MKVKTTKETNKHDETVYFYQIELEYLDLGNNFTLNHFINSLIESEELHEVLECLGEAYENDYCSIYAKGNHSNVVLNEYNCWELYDIIKTKL